MAQVRLICGVDEAGRGPLAGPVCAAAVVFQPGRRAPAGIADSKVLSSRERERLSILIKDRALAWAIAWASVEEIDSLNILQASLLAMRRAVELLSPGDRRWRRESKSDRSGIHPGEDRARCRDVSASRAVSAIRLRRAQGISDARASSGAAAARRVRSLSAQLSPGEAAPGKRPLIES